MNGIEKITEKIAEDMQSQIDEILLKAQNDAKQIEAKYIAEAEISCAKIREKGEQIASESASRVRSSAELEARKAILAKKQALVGLAFDKALEKLRSLPDNEYIALLVSLTVSAVRSGNEEVIFSPSDRSRFGKQVLINANKALADADKTANLTLSEKSLSLSGGVILVDRDIETNCSLDTLIRLAKDQLSLDVSTALFN